ncbi:MAG: aldo/keto reductase [Gemmatimonadaceae bacterium]|nr:aldo/keto reductase [Gemmatimonadaceae bacterium]
MERRDLTGTPDGVSVITLGTMLFGRPVPGPDAIDLVHAALDLGVNLFDTADIYEGYDRYLGSPGGVAEVILGEALRGRRDRAFITTKVGNPVGSGPDGGHPAGADYSGTGLGSAHVEQQIDASLRRLQTDYVDYYLLHIADAETPLEETLAAVDRIVAAGKVRHWGFSNFDADQIEAMLDLCRGGAAPLPVMAQPQYNWLERDLESGYLPVCQRAGIAITPYRPLAGGLLSGKYRRGSAPPAGSRASESAWIDEDGIPYEQLEPFHEEAAAAGVAPACYAVRWLLGRPGVVSVVAGVKSPAQLEELAACVR